MTPQEKRELAFSHVMMALDQVAISMNIAMTMVLTFAKATPKKVKQSKYSNSKDLKRIVAYRKKFNQIRTVYFQMRSQVIKNVKSN